MIKELKMNPRNKKQISYLTLIIGVLTLSFISACSRTADNQSEDTNTIMSDKKTRGQPGTAASPSPHLNSGISSGQ
jgi:hypothetical protein